MLHGVSLLFAQLDTHQMALELNLHSLRSGGLFLSGRQHALQMLPLITASGEESENQSSFLLKR